MHVCRCGKEGTCTLHIMEECIFMYVWVGIHMCASLNLKTENFQITCKLFEAITVIS